MLTSGQVFMAPTGTPPPTVRELQQATYGRRADTSELWQAVAYIANDGIDLDDLPAEDWHRANPPIAREFTFKMRRGGRRLFQRAVWGVYREPGDRPLIHKGKKP